MIIAPHRQLRQEEWTEFYARRMLGRVEACLGPHHALHPGWFLQDRAGALRERPTAGPR
jgi:hypothetical protein